MSQLLFILTGSIACYKACDAISKLVQRGHRVRTVATEAALRFVGPATLEGLTGEKVATDLFASGAALEHIALTRWADAVVVCPATAHTLNRMAAGFGDDLAGALLLAHDWKKPLVIAPAMNPAMWSHPATAASVGTETWFVTAGRTWPQLGTAEYPWYAKTRVFWPEKFGDWTSLMPDVSDELEVWASGAERKPLVA